jgi:hypothetical protein
MAEEIDARILCETIGSGAITMADGVMTVIGGFDSITTDVTNPGYNFVGQFGYFDLSGYSLQDKTLFPQGVGFQRIGTYGLANMTLGGLIREVLVVSTIPLSMSDFNVGTNYQTRVFPGDSNSRHNMEHIIAAECRDYDLDQGAAFARVSQATTWGIGDATAAQKLYYARVFILPAAGLSYGFQASGMAFVVPSVIAEEPELEYFMRLSRSTEQVN